jgi:hypothetical protein
MTKGAINKRLWIAANKLAGKCRRCSRLSVCDENGNKLTSCEYHRRRKRKVLGVHGYTQENLMSINYFVEHTTENDRCYAAGLIEGEGCFLPDARKHSKRSFPSIRVNMCDKEPVEWLFKMFGGSFSFRKSFNPKHMDQWAWSCGGRRAGAVAASIHRYIKSERKRKAASLVVKSASISGWWRSNKFATLDSVVQVVISKVKGECMLWRNLPHRGR